MSFDLTIKDIPHYTYKDYERWEGDWELIRGIPYAMSPAPGWKHQAFGSKFVTAFNNALKAAGKGCQCMVLYESDWIVSEDTVMRPDVMIVCEPVQGDHVTKPPALVLEILSPSSNLKDRNTKFNLYQAYGVRYYIIVSVEKNEIEIFQLQDNRYQQAELTKFQLSQACTVDVNVNNLFENPA